MTAISTILEFIFSGFAAALAEFVEETILGFAYELIAAILGTGAAPM